VKKMSFRLAALVVALFAFALTTTLSFAQEHGGTGSTTESGDPPAAGRARGGPAAQHGTPAPADHNAPAQGVAAPAPAHGSEHGAAAPAEHGAAAPGEHAEHGEGDHAGHHGPEALNWTDVGDKKKPAIIALVINFGVLMTLYYLLGKKPIAAALKQRRVTIGKDIDEAQALLDEAKELAKTYQAELKSADVDASTAKAGLISAGKGEVDRLLVEAQEKADRMKRDADRLVEQERKQVHLDILNETVDLAVHEAAKLLEKSVTADDHARLAQDLLAELALRPGAKPATTGRGAT
jgi:F-type H+-transporting ATPase subunit b